MLSEGDLVASLNQSDKVRELQDKIASLRAQVSHQNSWRVTKYIYRTAKVADLIHVFFWSRMYLCRSIFAQTCLLFLSRRKAQKHINKNKVIYNNCGIRMFWPKYVTLLFFFHPAKILTLHLLKCLHSVKQFSTSHAYVHTHCGIQIVCP